MPEYLACREAYEKHKRLGSFIDVETIDRAKITATLEISKADLDSAEALISTITKESGRWNSAYKLYYDALHECAESFLRFDKIKIDNHQALFAYLCEMHPELELDWDFFEKTRTKRNGINYYGQPITAEEVKSSQLQFKLYTKKLLEETESRLKAIQSHDTPKTKKSSG